LIKKETNIGSYNYIAPEVISSHKYSEKCDIYSLSIIIYILITRKFNPYDDMGKEEILLKIENDSKFRPVLNEYSLEFTKDNKWLIHLLSLCWNKEPFKRPSINSIIEQIKNKFL
jgi:serine/threonine protein kinase